MKQCMKPLFHEHSKMILQTPPVRGQRRRFLYPEYPVPWNSERSAILPAESEIIRGNGDFKACSLILSSVLGYLHFRNIKGLFCQKKAQSGIRTNTPVE
jgi:hypothetical protein